MIGIYDLVSLQKTIDNIPASDRVATNASYGHMYHLKKFAGIDLDTVMNCTIEHGFFTLNGGYCHEIMHNVSTILTWSKWRKRVIETRYQISAVPIGPYIAYVEGIYSEDIVEKIRNHNGKTLLVMPSHTSLEMISIFDFSEWIRIIESVAIGFKRILVCLPRYDLQVHHDIQYSRKGFDVVSAGSSSDINFLSRLKSILEISDAVMANDFTTGLLYALFLGKPVYLYKQKIKYGIRTRTIYRLSEKEDVLESFKNVASDNTFGNFEEQRNWGIQYAGFDSVKKREELREILIRNYKV